ncbi:hypothetical protein D3C77_524160 [compost metagenome]
MRTRPRPIPEQTLILSTFRRALKAVLELTRVMQGHRVAAVGIKVKLGHRMVIVHRTEIVHGMVQGHREIVRIRGTRVLSTTAAPEVALARRVVQICKVMAVHGIAPPPRRVLHRAVQDRKEFPDPRAVLVPREAVIRKAVQYIRAAQFLRAVLIPKPVRRIHREPVIRPFQEICSRLFSVYRKKPEKALISSCEK